MELKFETDSGQQAVIRSIKGNDIEKLLEFINQASLEDTYILLSGEKLTIEQETEFVQHAVASMEKGDSVYLVCEIDGQIVASSSAERKLSYKERAKHVADLGIIVAKDYRGEGIGAKLMSELANQAENLPGIKLLELGVFANNPVAQKLYSQLGFIEVGRVPKQILHRGEYVDHVLMVREAQQGFLK